MRQIDMIPEAFAKKSAPKTRLIGAAVFLVAIAVFYLSPNLQVFDSNYSILLSEVMLQGHTVDLSRVPFNVTKFHQRDIRNGYPYHIIPVKGRLLYYMPWGGSILALPAVAALKAVGISALSPTGQFDLAGECEIQKILAALLMAILAWLIFYTALLEDLTLSWAVVIALGTAFGTQVWSTASRALWEQTWLLLLLGVAIWALVRWKTGRGKFRPIAFATLMAWMYFVRPMASVPIMAISGYLLFTYPRSFPAYLITGLLWLGGFVACSMYFFGAPVPPYYHETWWLRMSGALHRLMGVLFSPSRGLFVYVPVLLFVLFLTARYWTILRRQKLVLMSLAVIVVDVAIGSTLTLWWGGWSYGPRELTETLPFFVLLAITGCRAFLNDTSLGLHSCAAIMSAGLVLLIVSVVINAPGALSPVAIAWNAGVDQQHKDLLWDWSRAPFLAPLSVAVTDAERNDWESRHPDRPGTANLAARSIAGSATLTPRLSGPVIESVNDSSVIDDFGAAGADWAPAVIFAKSSNPLWSWWDSDLRETVIIRGRNFDTKKGLAVGLFCPCPGSGQIGPFFFNPDNPNFDASRIILKIPPSSEPLPVGSGFLEVRNKGKDGAYSEISNHVWVSLGAPLRVRHVYQSGALVTVEGSGFEANTRINFYNSKSPFYQASPPLNLGGVDAAGKPKIPLTIDSDSQFTFKVPASAAPGEWYVEALNPPFLAFSSSYTDPGGAFVLH